MGNCLVLLREAEKAKKLIKIMTVDGKILEHRPPLKVHEALSEFPGHAISESLPVVRHLDPGADMRSGNLYYLLPPKKAVQASTEAKSEEGTRMVRIKLVVSKQELQEMLSKGGVVSLGEMISLLRGRSAAPGGGGDSAGRRSWKPILQTIPEASDLRAG